MITLNEESFIGNALENVKDYVDEIIIVDGGSTDNTVAIAKKLGAKVYFSKWPNDFSKQRNISLKYASKDWILVMDADEIYEKKLLENLQLYTNNNLNIDMFAFPRKNYIDGKLTDAYPDKQLRFFKNNKSILYEGIVHERPVNFNMAAYPTNLHIIHKKTSERQGQQNKRYEELIKRSEI